MEPNFQSRRKDASAPLTASAQSVAPGTGAAANAGAEPLRGELQALARRHQFHEQFLRELLHGLGNPLQALELSLLILRKHLPRDATPELKEDLLRLQSLKVELHRMVADAARYRRLAAQALEGQWVNLNALLERIHLSLDLRADDEFLVHEKLPELWAEESLMRAIFEPLVRNGFQHNTHKLRRISITAAPVEGAEKHWRFAVRDNGIGIAPDQQKRIFIPYQRMNDLDGEGSGMGLFLARFAAERLGGTISVKSELGKGSTFYVELGECCCAMK